MLPNIFHKHLLCCLGYVKNYVYLYQLSAPPNSIQCKHTNTYEFIVKLYTHHYWSLKWVINKTKTLRIKTGHKLQRKRFFLTTFMSSLKNYKKMLTQTLITKSIVTFCLQRLQINFVIYIRSVPHNILFL